MRSGVKERRVWLMKTHFPREVLGLNLNTPLNMCTETGGASWFLPEPGNRGRSSRTANTCTYKHVIHYIPSLSPSSSSAGQESGPAEKGEIFLANSIKIVHLIFKNLTLSPVQGGHT